MGTGAWIYRCKVEDTQKVVVGHWEDEEVHESIGGWMRSAIGISESRSLKLARFGDNMREVAVTEGDKVEAQIKLGWSVNYHPVGDLVEYIDGVSDNDVAALIEEYASLYDINTSDRDSISYQARIELGMIKFLQEGEFGAFTTTFEDLHGLKQLRTGRSRLMAKGCFGGEGLEDLCPDQGYEGNGYRIGRRHHLYGGLYISSGEGQ